METIKFRLVLASDGTIYEKSEIESRVAKSIIGDFELSPGGMIVLSTDVNANVSAGILGKAKGFLQTWYNRINRNKIIDKDVEDTVKKHGIETGWSIGNLFRGRYFSKQSGKTFNEKSLAIDIRGVPFDFVQEVARKLRGSFRQESVLVVDHSNNRTFILDS